MVHGINHLVPITGNHLDIFAAFKPAVFGNINVKKMKIGCKKYIHYITVSGSKPFIASMAITISLSMLKYMNYHGSFNRCIIYKNVYTMIQFFIKLWSFLKSLTGATISVNNEPTINEQEGPEVYEYTDETHEGNHEINKTDEVMEATKKNVLICLDNGHGEETPGKRSPWSACKVPPELPLREYKYCREIVSMLAQVLADDGYPVFVVVPEEWDVTLAERGRRINGMVNDATLKGMHALSISIHNNAAGSGKEWKKAYGWSVWTTRGQNNSDKLAQCLFDAAKEVLTPLDQKTRHDTSDGDDDYEDNFAMCRMPKCPAVLTENMFQDCVDEVRFLLSDEGKDAIVEIHRRGIERFVKLMGW
jgi:N-acetylmuramoyl-L-alanine amidase